MKLKSILFQLMTLCMFLLYGCSGGQQKSVQEFPKTGSVDRYHPSLDQIITPGERPEILAEGFDWSEGPLWLPKQELVIFSDIPNNSIYQWSEKGGLKLYLKPAGYTDTIPRGGETGSNGLLLNPEGKLVLCQHGDRRMATMNAPLNSPAPEFATIIDKWDGRRFNSPNDAVFSSTGNLYFTDPAYGMEFRYKDPKREMDFTGVFRYSTFGEVLLLTDQLSAPNGIGLSPDEKKLYVANSGGGEKSIWMEYELAEDGTVTNGHVFHDASIASDSLKGAPDGLVVREDGIIFATGPGGVWIFNPEGDNLGIVKTGQATSNCTLDADNQYLYMTADMYLMRIKLAN
jgi:gluconolactonase